MDAGKGDDMNTWILLLLWTALVAWLAYRYAEPAMQMFDRVADRAQAVVKFLRYWWRK